MRKIILLGSILIMFFSCNKEDSPTTPTDESSMQNSVSLTVEEIKEVL